jgi:hypothetical protein
VSTALATYLDYRVYRRFTRLGKYDKMEGSGAAKVVKESSDAVDHSDEKIKEGYEKIEVAEKN